MNLIERAKQYAEGAAVIADWLGAGGDTVEPDQAQRRANICLTCPLNRVEGIVAPVIAEEIRRQLEIKHKLNLHVGGETGLKGCAACGCETRLKIWVPLDRIKPEGDEIEKFDEHCWLRTEEDRRS